MFREKLPETCASQLPPRGPRSIVLSDRRRANGVTMPRVESMTQINTRTSCPECFFFENPYGHNPVKNIPVSVLGDVCYLFVCFFHLDIPLNGRGAFPRNRTLGKKCGYYAVYTTTITVRVGCQIFIFVFSSYGNRLRVRIFLGIGRFTRTSASFRGRDCPDELGEFVSNSGECVTISLHHSRGALLDSKFSVQFS